MICGGWTKRQFATHLGVSSRVALCLAFATLLSGCGDSNAPLADVYANYQPVGAWSTQAPTEVVPTEVQLIPNWTPPPQQPEPRVAGMMSVNQYAPSTQSVTESTTGQPSPTVNQVADDMYWSFPSEDAGPELGLPTPIRLPAIDEPIASSPATLEREPLALLMPPQAVREIQPEAPEPQLEVEEEFEPAESDLADLREIVPEETPLEPSQPEESSQEVAVDVAAETLSVLAELSEQERELAKLVRHASPAATGVLTNARIDEVAKEKIRQAYSMANRGSLYVARRELIEVLRLISQAKDAQVGTPHRSEALAAGLRALREAEDFAPRGTELEAEMNTAMLCASHRTPLAKLPESSQILPRLMLDRYLRYAQLQLSMAVAGEPAGSMALHALGKIHTQLGHIEPEANQLAQRHAIACQQAALLAHNQNFLAAHELAVLLAASGHFAESEQLLMQVAARAPNAVVHRNLARVQEKLGRTAQASQNLNQAQQLVRQGAPGNSKVQWVSPADFASSNTQLPRYRTAQQPAPSGLPIPGQRQPISNNPQRR